MTTDAAHLLPPNATTAEQALSLAAARVGDVPAPIPDVWRPDTCPAALLPWLAWAVSVDRWEADWTEAEKREAIAASIALHRVKGTRAAVDATIDRFDAFIEIVEWFEMRPPGAPHTFDLVIPLDLYVEPLTPQLVEKILREVVKVKPVRSHMTVVQRLPAVGQIDLVGAAQVAGFTRLNGTAGVPAGAWSTFLQTDDGEPFEHEGGEPGNYLEDIG